MNDAMTDGRLQIAAAVALLENSRLVDWISECCEFVAVDRQIFEWSWRKDIDPVFGRVICWISFAAGAEFLAKGTCLVRGVEIRKEMPVPSYPSEGIDAWASKFVQSPGSYGTIDVTNFGTLWNLTHDDNKTSTPAALSRLCSAVKADVAEKDLLFAGYEFLRKSIRNRDAHAYVPNVRDSHFSLVPELFTRCFNVLASWLPGGAPTLDQWRSDAREFVATL
jgi:hypothetical protein